MTAIYKPLIKTNMVYLILTWLSLVLCLLVFSFLKYERKTRRHGLSYRARNGLVAAMLVLGVGSVAFKSLYRNSECGIRRAAQRELMQEERLQRRKGRKDSYRKKVDREKQRLRHLETALLPGADYEHPSLIAYDHDTETQPS